MGSRRRDELGNHRRQRDHHLGLHDLLRVRTDAERFLLLAALNLVECVAYVGAQLQSR